MSNWKISGSNENVLIWEWECLNLVLKMPYFGICGIEFLKSIVIFEISTLKLVISETLTHTVNFGIESAFCKGPGLAFSESPGPGPDPFYKVCRISFH